MDNVKISSSVIETVTSPNGRVQAILTRTDGGPSLDYGYLVDLKLVAPNASPVRVANLYAAQKSKTEPGMSLAWRDDHTLELQYFTAGLTRVEQPDENIGGQQITTILKPQSP